MASVLRRETCRGILLVLAAALWAAPALAEEATGGVDATSADEAAARGTGIISVDVTQRPLKDVLHYLSRVSGYNVISKQDEVGDILVTLKLDNVYWRDALDVIAEKYKLTVDTSKQRSRVLMVDSPPRVYATFHNTDVKAAIQIIGDWGKSNIIIGPKVSGTVSGTLEDVPWREALEIVLKTLGYVVVEEKHGVLRIASPEELEAQLETRIFTLSYIQPATSQYQAVIQSSYLAKSSAKGGATEAASLLDVLDKVKSKNGSLAYEKRTNSVVVTDTSAKLETMQRLIDKLDVAPKQIHLNMKLVELTDTDAQDLGMQWGPEGGFNFSYSGPNFGTFFPFQLSGNGTNGLIDTPIENLVPGVSATSQPARVGDGGLLATAGNGLTYGTLNFSGLSATLNMIKTQTNGKIIQAPQIIALDNEEATIHVGKRIRYAEQFVSTTEGGGAASGFQEASGSPVELGIQVLVIPHVTGNDNNVILTIIPKTEDFTDPGQPFEEFVGAGITLKLPQTSQRIVVTKMMLRNGETGVIAGLREERTGTTITKVPFFGDIPILGWLFRHKSYTKSASNLLMFVTPTIIDFGRQKELTESEDAIRRELGRPFSVFEEEAPGAAPEEGPGR